MRRFYAFSLDVILQALFSYIWDERGLWDEKIRTNEELVNEANRPASGCANGSTSDHACWASAYLYRKSSRFISVFR